MSVRLGEAGGIMEVDEHFRLCGFFFDTPVRIVKLKLYMCFDYLITFYKRLDGLEKSFLQG